MSYNITGKECDAVRIPKYRSVLCIYYPHQLLPALVALIHYRRFCLQEPIEQKTLICVRILIENEQGNNIARAIKNIVKNITWVSVVITYAWKLSILREYYFPIKWRAYFLRRTYKEHPIQQIVYAHDLSADFFPQTFMHAFPKSKRICFGDSLGIVYSPNYFTDLRYSDSIVNASLLQHITIKMRRFVQLYRRWFVLPKKVLQAHDAILILPSDPGGDFFKTTQLHIPQKTNVSIVLTELSSNCNDPFIDKLLASTTQKIVFFALSNLSDSKLTTQEKELLLYQEIIDTYVPKNAILIVKPHPGSHHTFLMELKKRVHYQCDIHYLSQEFSVYPIEFYSKLLLRADMILSISYTSVSIPYLYKKEVLHVLTDELIEKYILPQAQTWMREGNQHYLRMIADLAVWDGKTLIG